MSDSYVINNDGQDVQKQVIWGIIELVALFAEKRVCTTTWRMGHFKVFPTWKLVFSERFPTGKTNIVRKVFINILWMEIHLFKN